MILLIFSFLAGIVTILSPCILPILPIVLSGSIDDGKKRPLGIIAGFILSFTFFTLALSTIVKATGLSADGLRNVAIVVIAMFGVSMISPKFQMVLEKIFSKIVIVPKTTNGFFLGASLGLVWAPCVGPILASVITLAATSSVNFLTILITLAYSVGTAIPMLIIMYGGRKYIPSLPNIQKIFGLLMITTALALFFNWDRWFQTYILEKFPNYGTGLTKFEEIAFKQQSFKKIAPEIIPGGEWFNSEPLMLSKLRGKVVLLDFWTYTCINCIRTLPYLKNWHTKYSDAGLVIIGVHTPEFEFEKEAKNVKKAIKDFGLEYPVVQDNDYATWRAYDNHYWPAKYLIDKNGNIVYTHFGEGDYDETEKKIQEFLDVDMPVDNATYQVNGRTPETYLGTAREGNGYTLEGIWTKSEEYATPSRGATLTFPFTAAKVFLVMRGNGNVKVFLDENFIQTVTVDVDKLYELIDLPQPGEHILKLEFLDDTIKLYAFTFG